MKLLHLLVVLLFVSTVLAGPKHHAHRKGKAGKVGKAGKAKHPVPEPVEEPEPVRDSSQIGDRLLRTFGVFKNQPLTPDDAQDQGFTAFTDGCAQFGVGYAKGDSGPTKGDSAILYYTAGGQLSGFGTRMWGEPEENLVPDYWVPVDGTDGAYDLIIQTRDSDFICSGDTDDNLLGDRISINGIMDIPLVMDDAQSAGWVEGNCIPKMGVHHAFDINSPGDQTWNASSLIPVMPMFHPQTRAITAVLLASTDAQRIEPFGDWEGPFINMLFCKNWCANTGCTFPGVGLWTTMHWLFEDPSLNQCAGANCVI